MSTPNNKEFYATFDPSKSANIFQEIDKEFPGYRDFKIAEFPAFLDNTLKAKLLMAGNSCLDVILAPDFLNKNEHLKAPYDFGNRKSTPDFICLDFAITEDNHGEFCPQLIEVQGFPTLIGFQQYLTSKYKKHLQIPAGLTSHFNRINTFNFSQKIGSMLNQYGVNTILLEAYPSIQRTRLDFKLTEVFWGINTVCLSQLAMKDNKLGYISNDQFYPIDAIYNRVIIEEVLKKYPELVEKLILLTKTDVNWISHPDWYYLISKSIMPQLNGMYVPNSFYYQKGDELPENLENYVLKPLFDYGGDGVILNLTKQSLENCKENEMYILQEKVTYSDWIMLKDGQKRKGEVRLIYGQEPSKKRPTLLANLTRISDSGWMNTSQHAADFTGGSVAFFENL